jgi:hypothetical protein
MDELLVQQDVSVTFYEESIPILFGISTRLTRRNDSASTFFRQDMPSLRSGGEANMAKLFYVWDC